MAPKRIIKINLEARRSLSFRVMAFMLTNDCISRARFHDVISQHNTRRHVDLNSATPSF
jgi:hypothetical protein